MPDIQNIIRFWEDVKQIMKWLHNLFSFFKVYLDFW